MIIASNIYNFSDYREFLKDRYRQLKAADPIFSFRTFSKEAGFGSPNYLKLVMDGKRNLSEDAIGKFAKGLRLDSHESEFFYYMVEFNQCELPAKKKVFEAKLIYLRELFKVKSLIPELYDYYHEWYHSAIREVIRKGAVKNDAAALAQRLVPSISREEAMVSIELLKKLGFIVETGNELIATDHDNVDEASHEMAQKIHHEQMASLAAQSLYIQGPETQEFESLTLSLSPEKMQELKVRIRALVVELEATNQSHEAAVYQLNIQFFALTKPQETTTVVTTDATDEATL